jgi:AraC-like DNA-binding protein
MLPAVMERRLRVWNIIQHHASNPLSGFPTIQELCQQTGASERMLRDVSHAFSGRSVMAYITQERLHLARVMLERGRPQEVTVTDVATFCGFHHLSRFSRDFRDCHGELPSRILRRQPEATVY